MRQTLTYLSIGCFLLFHSVKGQAQANHKSADPRQYVFRAWNNQNGIPQNTINDMVLDQEGYLWAGTEEGLIRFDGADFSIKNDSNTPGLYSNTFYDLSTSGDAVWASSRNTVIKLINQRVKTFDFREILKGGWIKCIEADGEGKLWVGASNGSMFLIRNDSVTRLTLTQAPVPVEALCRQGKTMLVGTTTGLYQIQADGKLQPYAPLAGISVTAMAVEESGQVWVGTAEEGLFRLGKDVLHITERDGLKEPYINSLATTASGRLYIGTRSSGFQLYENGKLTSPPQNQYAHDGIKSILPTEEETIWLGTTSSGLLQMRPSQIQMLLPGEEISKQIILPIYQDPSGDVWVGTAGQGVNRIQDGRVTNYSIREGLSNNLVLSIYGRNDYIFIGTANGLNRFNKKTGRLDRKYSKNEGLASNSIQAVFYDTRNQLWVISRNGGVHLINEKEEVIRQPLPQGMDNVNYLTIFEDSHHNIWLGSRGSGILRREANGNWTRFHHQNGFTPDIVYSFLEDDKGAIWMGTEKGLACYNNGKFTVIDKNSGLRFNEIYRILADNRGFVWLSGNFGLQRASLSALQAVGSSRVDLQACKLEYSIVSPK